MRVLLVSTLLFLVACNNSEKSEKKDNVTVAGAWKMLSQRLKTDKTDTTSTALQQLKIFTGDHMMYANIDPADSVGGFGVGSYTVEADTVSEHVIYNASGSAKDDTARTFKLGITKSDKGYKQVIPDIMDSNGQHGQLTEEYEMAGTDTKSPLDGVWKLTKALTVKGKDTTVDNVTQYKAYFAGHVIWGHTFSDSLKKNHTGIGFGTFEMQGNNKAKENMTASTYYVIRGQSFDLDITMKGEDEFTQTITEKDGTKGMETYQRLKK